MNKFEIHNNIKLNKYLIFNLKFITASACFIILLNNYIIENYIFTNFAAIENLKINITSVNYSFSYIFHIAKIEYNFVFYDLYNKIIEPSDLSLYYNLHIFCHSIEINNNLTIKYISYVRKNKYFNCIEYLNIHEKMNFGITLYKKDKYYEYFIINLFPDNLINYNNFFFKYNEEFDPLILLKNYFQFEKLINGKIKLGDKTFLLTKSYFIMPQFSIKSNSATMKEKWYFKNIYNN